MQERPSGNHWSPGTEQIMILIFAALPLPRAMVKSCTSEHSEWPDVCVPLRLFLCTGLFPHFDIITLSVRHAGDTWECRIAPLDKREKRTVG